MKRGAVVRYRLSERARTRFLIQRRLPGRRVVARGKRRCVKPTRRLVRRKARPCARFRKAGVLVRRGRPGLNRFRFTGRVGRRALRPGAYRLVARSTDSAGNRSKVRRRGFRILRGR